MPFPARKCLQELLGNCFSPFTACMQREEDNPLLLSVTRRAWCGVPKSSASLMTVGCLKRYDVVNFVYQDSFLKQCGKNRLRLWKCVHPKLRKATFQVCSSILINTSFLCHSHKWTNRLTAWDFCIISCKILLKQKSRIFQKE